MQFFKILILVFIFQEVKSQDTLNFNGYLGINEYYFKKYKLPKKSLNGPCGDIEPLVYNDTITNFNHQGFFLVKSINKKLHRLKSKNYAPIERYENNSTDDYIDSNNLIYRNFVLNKTIKRKKVNYTCYLNKEKYLYSITYIKAKLTYIIIKENEMKLLTEFGIKKNHFSLIKIISLE